MAPTDCVYIVFLCFLFFPSNTVIVHTTWHFFFQYFLDIDECSEGTDVCEDVCYNVEGSYRCDCSGPGFKLSWDFASCSGITL